MQVERSAEALAVYAAALPMGASLASFDVSRTTKWTLAVL
jgi:hypothetical protein